MEDRSGVPGLFEEGRRLLAPSFHFFNLFLTQMRKKSLPFWAPIFKPTKNEKEVIAILGSNFQTHKFLSKSSLCTRVVTEQRRFSKQWFFSLAKFRHFSTKKLGKK
jgi:hypothetical protein